MLIDSFLFLSTLSGVGLVILSILSTLRVAWVEVDRCRTLLVGSGVEALPLALLRHEMPDVFTIRSTCLKVNNQDQDFLGNYGVKDYRNYFYHFKRCRSCSNRYS